MEPMNIKDAVKYVVKESVYDWAASKMEERDARSARCRARMEEAEKPTTSRLRKLQLNTAEFLEDMGPVLIPAVVVFGAIGHAIWRVFFQ